MSAIVCREVKEKSTGETVLISLDMRPYLDVHPTDSALDELCIGTPTVVELTTTALVIDNKLVTTAARIIKSNSVPAGKALTFRVAGGLAAGGQVYDDPRPGATGTITAYAILITVSTTASVQTRQVIVLVQVIAATP